MPNNVTEGIAAELKRHWDEGDIVEILGVIALFGFLNRWNDSMATSLETDAEATAERHLSARGWTRGKHQ